MPQSAFPTDKQYTDPALYEQSAYKTHRLIPVLQFEGQFPLYEPLSLANRLLFPALLRHARFTNLVECAERKVTVSGPRRSNSSVFNCHRTFCVKFALLGVTILHGFNFEEFVSITFRIRMVFDVSAQVSDLERYLNIVWAGIAQSV